MKSKFGPAAALLLTIIILTIIIGTAVWLGHGLLDGRSSTSASAVPIVTGLPSGLSNLGPGTTLHMKFKEYTRYDPRHVADVQSLRGLPETAYVESRLSFDTRGNLKQLWAQTTGADGVVYQRTESDGTDLVYEDGAGVVQRRRSGLLANVTVSNYESSIINELARASGSKSTLGARMGTLNGEPVTITEETVPISPQLSRLLTPEPPGRSGYDTPFIADLAPVREVTRSYLSADNMQLRHEVAVVDSDGNETVVESSEQLLVEVITN